MSPLNSTYISTAATTTVKSGKGRLARIVLTETAVGTITIYDNTTATGTIVAVIKASAAEQTFEFQARMLLGITVVTAAASKLTVIWE
jgi:hypothetical protein